MKMDWTEKTWIVATCGRGCAEVLKAELRALGYEPQEVSPTSVGIEGNLQDAMRLNLWLRTANRVLFEVGGFEIDSSDDLYDAVRGLPWEQWLRADAPFHVHGVAQHPSIRDPRFAVLRCKDAIADRFVDATGSRPDSTSTPDGASCVALYWKEQLEKYMDQFLVNELSRRGLVPTYSFPVHSLTLEVQDGSTAPGLDAAGQLDGAGYPGAGFRELLYLVNVDTRPRELTLPAEQGKAWHLHPVHLAPAAADPRPASAARYDAASGRFSTPPRTALVWVLD